MEIKGTMDVNMRRPIATWDTFPSIIWREIIHQHKGRMEKWERWHNTEIKSGRQREKAIDITAR